MLLWCNKCDDAQPHKVSDISGPGNVCAHCATFTPKGKEIQVEGVPDDFFGVLHRPKENQNGRS